MSDDRIAALDRALEKDPDNHPLRLLLAEMLEREGRGGEALDQYDRLLEGGRVHGGRLVEIGRLAVGEGRLALAGRCLAAAREAGVVEGTADLQQALDAQRGERGVLRLVRPAPAPARAAPATEREGGITFGDVGGLDEVKKTIHRMIVLPYLRPDLYKAYGREGGGGVMLYGPPGCGKTLLARAVAGECGLRFLNVRIEEILDPYLGVSERNLHGAFEAARQQAPCVLFLDELDALAFSRRKHVGGAARPLVDPILQELDAIGSDNRDLLILAATNAPWDVDDALKRPGRFDRVLFVAPPDRPARREILARLLRGKPAASLDLERLALLTPLFSGADLRALVDAAVDRVIDEALGADAGPHPPLQMAHLEAARAGMRPTTLDWLARARNYVEFANRDRRYDDVASFLRSADVTKHGDS